MDFIPNEMNFNKIFNKFNEFYNDINTIKTKIINEINFILKKFIRK